MKMIIRKGKIYFEWCDRSFMHHWRVKKKGKMKWVLKDACVRTHISLVLPSRTVNLQIEKRSTVHIESAALSFIRQVLPASRSQNGTSKSEWNAWELFSFWSSYRRPQRFTFKCVPRCSTTDDDISLHTLSLSLPIILPLYICSRIYTVYIILHTFRLLFSGYVMLYLFSRLGAQSTGPGSPVDYTFIFSISLWCYQTIWHGDISLSWTQFVGYTQRERKRRGDWSFSSPTDMEEEEKKRDERSHYRNRLYTRQIA
jgi:hypothetical protein